LLHLGALWKIPNQLNEEHVLSNYDFERFHLSQFTATNRLCASDLAIQRSAGILSVTREHKPLDKSWELMAHRSDPIRYLHSFVSRVKILTLRESLAQNARSHHPFW
jgi:hypothetical protein